MPTVETTAPEAAEPRFRRRIVLPAVLFAATCLSTFWVGLCGWEPLERLGDVVRQASFLPLRMTVLAGWRDGLIYAGALLTILLLHEMGHFVASLRCRVPASLPYFLPIPFNLVGTLGAVIGMAGMRADRRELFDIGLAGPLAGLVAAVPILWIGVQGLDLSSPGLGPLMLEPPLLARWMLAAAGTPGYDPQVGVFVNQLNPWFMAGWVGLLVTGLNMMPVSQLDGGHVVFALLGPRAGRLTGRLFLIGATVWMLANNVFLWWPMVLLVLFFGPDHPPTRNDRAPLGLGRTLLGWASLAIPILCFPPRGLILVGP